MQIVEKACSTLENFDKDIEKIKEKNSTDAADQYNKLVEANKNLLNLVNHCILYIGHTKYVGDEKKYNINLKEIEINLFKNNIVDTEKFKSLTEKVFNILDSLIKSIEIEKKRGQDIFFFEFL